MSPALSSRFTCITAAMLVAATAFFGCSEDSSSTVKKVEKIEKSGGVAGLRDFLLSKDGDGAAKAKALEVIVKTPGSEAEKVLLELAAGPEGTARDTALNALVKRKSEAAVPLLVSRLLNILQTGGKGDAEVEAIKSINPGALVGARDGMLAKARQAREDGAVFAAKQYLENAQTLSRLLDGKDLSGETAALEQLKTSADSRKREAALLAAMENGQLTRMYTIALSMVETNGPAELKTLLPEMERLSRLEDHFYSVAKALETARVSYETAKKSGGKGEQLAKLKAEFDTQKGNMILARRGLERERQKLPAMTEQVRAMMNKLR